MPSVSVRFFQITEEFVKHLGLYLPKVTYHSSYALLRKWGNANYLYSNMVPVIGNHFLINLIGVHATSARVLLFLVIPGHIFFVTVAWLVRLYPEGKSYDFLFLFAFVLAALIQVNTLHAKIR